MPADFYARRCFDFHRVAVANVNFRTLAAIKNPLQLTTVKANRRIFVKTPVTVILHVAVLKFNPFATGKIFLRAKIRRIP